MLGGLRRLVRGVEQVLTTFEVEEGCDFGHEDIGDLTSNVTSGLLRGSHLRGAGFGGGDRRHNDGSFLPAFARRFAGLSKFRRTLPITRYATPSHSTLPCVGLGNSTRSRRAPF